MLGKISAEASSMLEFATVYFVMIKYIHAREVTVQYFVQIKSRGRWYD